MENLKATDPEAQEIIEHNRPVLVVSVYHVPGFRDDTDMVADIRWAAEVEEIPAACRPLAKLYQVIAAAASGLVVMNADLKMRAIDRGLLSSPPAIEPLPILSNTAIVPGRASN